MLAVWYRDEFLDPIVKLHFAEIGLSFVIMDENGRLHRVYTIVNILSESEGFARMEYLAY